MVSMTFGETPDEDLFYANFEERCKGKFVVRSGACRSDPLEGEWWPEELWAEVADTSRRFRDGELDIDDPRLDSCNAVLTVLGFEWV